MYHSCCVERIAAFLSGIKNAPGWVPCVSCPRAPSRLRSVHVSRAVSVTGWGNGGGRYSQRLRVGSSRSERRLIEALLLGCGLVSRSGLCCGRPLTAATRARPVLLSVVPLLALRRRLVGLLR